MKKTLSVIISSVLLIGLIGGVVMSLSSCAPGKTYYISSSGGSDTNDGTSQKTPWKSFENVNRMFLEPGDRVLLKKGDVWHERLEIRGSGEENAWITISSYGDSFAEQPIISLDRDKDDICVLVTDLNDQKELKFRKQINYVQIDGLDIRNSYLGIYFRFAITCGNTGFKVVNCNFKNMYSDEVFADQLSNLQKYLAWRDAPKGNLAAISSYGTYHEDRGGAGEYIWPDAIRVGGKGWYSEAIASEFDINNCVFEDCTGGFHVSLSSSDVYNIMGVTKVRMSDCVGTGSYGGIYRFECVDGGYDGTSQSEWGYVRNVRHIGGSHLAAGVTGPTASYMAVCDNILVDGCEMSYLYNNGMADGCGFDYETYVRNVTQKNMVYHNNDAEGILMLRPGEGLSEYIETHLLNAFFYNNLKRPLTTELNSDIMCGSSSDTISFKDIYIYMTKFNPANTAVKTSFIGPLGNKAVKENNTFAYLEDYRSRFAFNGNSYESWNYAADGISDLKVENGKLSFKLTGTTGYIASSLPLNLFAYTGCIMQLEGTTAASVEVGIRETGSETFVIGPASAIDGSTVTAKISSDAAFATGMLLQFKGKAGDTVVIDSIEYTTEYKFSARLIDEGKTVRLTVSGKSNPMFENTASEKGITVSGLPSGVNVTSIEQYKSDVVLIHLSDAIESGTELGLSIAADQFIPYFAEMLGNLDFGNRTPAEEAELFGYSGVQSYVKNGTVSGSVTVE